MVKFDDKILERFSRQIIIDKVGIEGQQKIMKSSILIVGCGGLGSSAAQYLVMSGIGQITLVDNDEINLSNLNRQTLFLEKDLGKKKAISLAKKLKKINPFTKVNHLHLKLSKKNINKLTNKFEILLDCSDNFETKYLLNKFCIKRKKKFVSAALQNFDVQAHAFCAWENSTNPCYECIFPQKLNTNSMSCDEMGILAPVAGFGGILQAILTLDIILKSDKDIFKEMILFDSFKRNFTKIKTKKNKNCLICN